jgi:uncharacterized protein YwqG
MREMENKEAKKLFKTSLFSNLFSVYQERGLTAVQEATAKMAFIRIYNSTVKKLQQAPNYSIEDIHKDIAEIPDSIFFEFRDFMDNSFHTQRQTLDEAFEMVEESAKIRPIQYTEHSVE